MKSRGSHLIDFVMYLGNKGFPHLALEHLHELKGSGEVPEDVLCCTEGVVLSENMGRGVDALRCFEKALEINPCYPQAARLASMYALTIEDMVKYIELFFDGMDKLTKKKGFFAQVFGAKNEDSFPRYSNNCQIWNSTGKEKIIQNDGDILMYHYAQALKIWDKMPAKELAIGSIINEIVKIGDYGKTQISDEHLRDRIRNCIELCIKANMQRQALQTEYMQPVAIPEDNFFAQDAVKYANNYLEQYDPFDTVVLNWKASALRELERYEECIAVCDENISIRPESYYFHYTNKALALIELGRCEEAEELFGIIERETAGKDANILQTLKDAIARHKEYSTLITWDAIKQYYQGFIGGAAYAAKDEIEEAKKDGRMEMLSRIASRLRLMDYYNLGQEIADLLNFFTPACVYEYLTMDYSTNNDEFVELLLDTFDIAFYPGIIGEMFSELCWMFAFSPKNYQRFAPLRNKLILSLDWQTADVSKTALRRILPPLFEYIENSEKWGRSSAYSIVCGEISKEQWQRFMHKI